MVNKVIFEKKNILILGGAGFIGSHLIDHLIKENKIICVDNFSSGTERNIDHLLSHPNFRFIKHDMAMPLVLEDLTELDDFKLEFQGIQEIYNLACPTSPKYFEKNRLANILANSYAIKNSLDLALKYRAKFMQFSSSVVYGLRNSDVKRIPETDMGISDQLSDRASYDEGKRFAETMIKTYHQVFDLDTKIVRLFRIYGPRMPFDEGHMIPDFIKGALENKPLIVHGDDSFSTSLCYIDDCISGVIKMMASDLFGPINIGSDIDMKLVDVAKKIIAEIGSTSEITYEEPLLFMTPLALPDIALAREALTWLPLVTLENGLKKTIKDIEANKGVRNFEEAL